MKLNLSEWAAKIAIWVVLTPPNASALSGWVAKIAT